MKNSKTLFFALFFALTAFNHSVFAGDMAAAPELQAPPAPPAKSAPAQAPATMPFAPKPAEDPAAAFERNAPLAPPTPEVVYGEEVEETELPFRDLKTKSDKTTAIAQISGMNELVVMQKEDKKEAKKTDKEVQDEIDKAIADGKFFKDKETEAAFTAQVQRLTLAEGKKELGITTEKEALDLIKKNGGKPVVVELKGKGFLLSEKVADLTKLSAAAQRVIKQNRAFILPAVLRVTFDVNAKGGVKASVGISKKKAVHVKPRPKVDV